MSRRAKTYSRSYARRSSPREQFSELVTRLRAFTRNVMMRSGGAAMIFLAGWLAISLASFSISDPSFNTATPAAVSNLGGAAGANIADLLLQALGGAAFMLIAPFALWGAIATIKGAPEETPHDFWVRLAIAPVAVLCGAALAAALPTPASWPFMAGPGGVAGDFLFDGATALIGAASLPPLGGLVAGAFGGAALIATQFCAD